MSGRTRWMISATARACGSSAVDSVRNSAPAPGRLRLQLKVAMRTVPLGLAGRAAGARPAARISNARVRRTPRSEVELERAHHGARRTDREEAHRRSARARADVAEVLLVKQVGDVELHAAAFDALEVEGVADVEIEHGVAGRDLVVEVGGEAIVDLLALQADVQVGRDLEIRAHGEHPLRRLHQLLALGGGGRACGRDVVLQLAVVVRSGRRERERLTEAAA